MAENVARMGDRRGAYRVKTLKSEGKRPLGRPRCRWEDNIKLIFDKWNGDTYTRFTRFRIGHMVVSCDLSNKTSGPLQCRVLLDFLRTC